MSEPEASTLVEQRLIAAAQQVGVPLSGGDAARLAPLLERLEAGLVETHPEPLESGPVTAIDTQPPEPARGNEGPTNDGFAWTVPGGGLSPTGSGPLDGWRLAVKDLVAVGGHARRCGSAALFDAPIETTDAPVVAAFRQAGARLVGGTHLHEFAFGTTGINLTFGTPLNPAAPARVPGGSSSGAAVVVADGLADLAIGTDTGGSVRIPAGLCGVVGFKPSFGAVPMEGVWPLSPSLDHVGYLVATTAELVAPALALGLIGPATPPSPVDDVSAPEAVARQLRLGVARGAAGRCSDDVGEAFKAALARLASAGIELVDLDWPGGDEVFAATTAIMYAEAAHGHRRLLAARHHLYGVDVRNRLLQGLAIPAVSYLRARQEQADLRKRCLATLDQLDAVLTPTVPVVAPRRKDAADPAVAAQLVTFTRLADVAGLPAISIPLPASMLAGTGGLPVGLQVEAASDPAAIQVALALGGVLGV
jgi:aspartyl-tRNA(Asn)/glutamyl-tRNA(Gln) amidotransferase subunit A